MKIKRHNLRKFFMENGEEITPPEVTATEQQTETPKAEEPKVDTTKIAELESIIANLTNENNTLKGQVSEHSAKAQQFETTINELTGIKSEYESLTNKATTYETTLKSIVDSKMGQVPEQYKPLMPKTTDITEQLNWLTQAESTGLFGNKNIEIGKPMNPATHKEHIDTSNMSPTNLMAMAYGSKK